MGGAVTEGALSTEDVTLVNGVPNVVWGWRANVWWRLSHGGHALLQGDLARRERSSPHAHP